MIQAQVHIPQPTCRGITTSKPVESDPEVLLLNETSYFHIKGDLCGQEVTFLVDTGSSIDCLHIDTYNSLEDPPELSPAEWENIYAVDGRESQCFGKLQTTVSISYQDIISEIELDLYVINCGTQEGILGCLFLVNHSAKMDAGTGDVTFIIQGRTIHTTLQLLPGSKRPVPTVSSLSHHKDKKPDQDREPAAKKPRSALKLKKSKGKPNKPPEYDENGIQMSATEAAAWRSHAAAWNENLDVDDDMLWGCAPKARRKPTRDEIYTPVNPPLRRHTNKDMGENQSRLQMRPRT